MARKASTSAEEGAPWFKAYTWVSRAELAAIVEEAHRLGAKVTGDICPVTFQEAIELGIDDLEHGILMDTEAWPGKEPDVCPAINETGRSYRDVDLKSNALQTTLRAMVECEVALTSTLAYWEYALTKPNPVEARISDL